MVHVLIHAIVWGIKAANKASQPDPGKPGGGTKRELAGLRANLKQIESDRGSKHPSLLQPLGALASLHAERGELPQALEVIRRAAAIVDATPLDALEREAGPGRAEWILQRGLQLAIKHHGEGHPSVAVALVSQGGLSERQGQWADAERELRRALEIEQGAFGVDHPRLAAILEPLARVVGAQARQREALPLWGRALAIREKAAGEAPTLVPALCGLATACQALGMVDQAETSLWRAIALRKNELGAEHPEVHRLMDALGSLYQSA